MSFTFITPTVNKNGVDGLLLQLSVYPEKTGPNQAPLSFVSAECDDTGKIQPGKRRVAELYRGDGDGDPKDDDLIAAVEIKINEIEALIKSKFA